MTILRGLRFWARTTHYRSSTADRLAIDRSAHRFRIAHHDGIHGAYFGKSEALKLVKFFIWRPRRNSTSKQSFIGEKVAILFTLGCVLTRRRFYQRPEGAPDAGEFNSFHEVASEIKQTHQHGHNLSDHVTSTDSQRRGPYVTMSV